MTESLGEIISSKNETMLKMWNVHIEAGKRPYHRHGHTRFEITLVTDGDGKYTTSRGKFSMHKGDIVVFSSNELHNISEAGSNGLSITNMHFEPRYLLGTDSDGLSHGYMNFCFTHSPDFKNLIESNRAQPIRELFLKIKDEITEQKGEYRLAIKSYLNLLLITLLRDFRYQSAERVSNKQLSNMLKAIEYIDGQICEKISLDDISASAGISPNYFCSLFRQLNGTTLWDYISAKRIEKAIQLISERADSDTMLSIGLQCGFNNTASFNKTFKKQTGMTPTQYRNADDILLH